MDVDVGLPAGTLLIFIQSGCRITRVCNLRFGLLIFIVYRSTVDIPDGQGGPTGPLSIRRVRPCRNQLNSDLLT